MSSRRLAPTGERSSDVGCGNEAVAEGRDGWGDGVAGDDDLDVALAELGARGGSDAGIGVGAQGRSGHGRDGKASRNQRLLGDEVIGCEGHRWAEPRALTGCDQMGAASVATCHPCFFAELAQSVALPPGRAMPGRNHDVDRIVTDRRRGQVAVSLRRGLVVAERDRYIDVPGPQRSQGFRRLQLLERCLDRREIRPQRRQSTWHQRCGRGRVGSDADPASPQPGNSRDFFPGSVQSGEHRIGMCSQRHTCLCQSYAPAVAYDQRSAELTFQLGDVMSHRRLGVGEGARCPCQRSMPGDLLKDPQPVGTEHGVRLSETQTTLG